MALVATYDGNLLAFNEIFCAIKGALCRELWAPYFSSSEVRSPNISQAYITHKSEGSNCKQVPVTMYSSRYHLRFFVQVGHEKEIIILI